MLYPKPKPAPSGSIYVVEFVVPTRTPSLYTLYEDANSTASQFNKTSLRKPCAVRFSGAANVAPGASIHPSFSDKICKPSSAERITFDIQVF